MKDLYELLKGNTYPGRGIVAGRTADGKYAAALYFIMGRSLNSRNRIFVPDGTGIRTEAYDPSKMTDPSLIIYSPVRTSGFSTVVTNGDQTDTVVDLMTNGASFEEALSTRTFEPDGPNYTPRISALLHVINHTFDLKLSILKSDHGDPECAVRETFTYDKPKAGKGYFIHTYQSDGDPLPSFAGEPEEVALSGDIDEVTQKTWEALDPANKVSLFVRFIDIGTGKYESRIVNKNEK